MTVTFFYSPQSSATRVHWALEELGIPYEKVRIDLRAGDQRKPDFLAINPNGKVPALVVDGAPMFESSAIQIYLGERFGVDRGLWPAAGTGERAQALSWLCWGQVSLGAAFNRYFANTSEWFPKELHHAPAAEAALKEIHVNLGILEARLQGREWIVGHAFNLADLDIAAMLGWGLYAAKIETGNYPGMNAWLARASGRAGFKTAMAS
jgi:glutathione S-transferase